MVCRYNRMSQVKDPECGVLWQIGFRHLMS
jgi:hypothetical protein